MYEPDRDGENDLPLLAAPLDDPTSSYPALGPAWAADWLTTHVDLEDGWAALLGYVGNDSAIEFRTSDGSSTGQDDPIVEHGDPALDSVVAVAISSDRSRVTFVEERTSRPW